LVLGVLVGKAVSHQLAAERLVRVREAVSVALVRMFMAVLVVVAVRAH
jgi:hypothetical protein